MTAPADADDRLARMEAAEDAPESLRWRMAEALHQAEECVRCAGEPHARHFRAADVALAVVTTPVPGVAKGDGADEARGSGT